MKKIFLPLAAIALAMVCATGCKNAAGSDKDSAAKADSAAKNDVTARVNHLGELQLELQELQMSLQEDLVEKAKTLSPKEFAAYYEKFCNAQLDLQQEMANKAKDMEARVMKLQAASADPKVKATMESPEVKAADERVQQRMQKFYEEQMQQQMQQQMQMAPATDSLATA